MATTDIRGIGNELARGALGSEGVERILPLLPAIYRLLARGRPVAVAEVAAATARSEAVVADDLGRFPALERDAEGRIVGLGITLNPTPHRFRVAGHDLYTWCALDTLTFPHVLGERAEVESPCNATGTPVRLTVSPEGVSAVEPASAVVSVLPIERAPNIRTAFCDHVHFFRSEANASDWLAQHPGGRIVSVADGFAIGRGFAEAIALSLK